MEIFCQYHDSGGVHCLKSIIRQWERWRLQSIPLQGPRMKDKKFPFLSLIRGYPQSRVTNIFPSRLGINIHVYNIIITH